MIKISLYCTLFLLTANTCFGFFGDKYFFHNFDPDADVYDERKKENDAFLQELLMSSPQEAQSLLKNNTNKLSRSRLLDRMLINPKLNYATCTSITTIITIIDMLLQKKSDIDTIKRSIYLGKTALYIAITYAEAHPAIIACLLDHGADPNAPTFDIYRDFDCPNIKRRTPNLTPMQFVNKNISHWHTYTYLQKIKRLFLEYPLLLAQEKESPNNQLLTQAIELNAITMVQRLLKTGIIPQTTDLELAASLDHKEISTLLTCAVEYTNNQCATSTTSTSCL